ncbi:uncharacterized protein LOC108815502 [Raphanus sativus]|uniref:Uncharacterized protein LOC108815502 n=1 Tax=Raphanus sativus TaxID=3726 RepID=A0A9W3DEC7_RAPSA|nr:uncharacterized protein LOC108815502 [Raphanus sativus]
MSGSHIQTIFGSRTFEIISNFILEEQTGSYKTTYHPYKICFLPFTGVRPARELPESVCEVQPEKFADLLDRSIDPDYLFDVIGQVVKINNVDHVNINGKETKILFVEFCNAEEVNETIELCGGHSTVCLFRYMKLIVMKDISIISNTHHVSSFTFNPPLAGVHGLLSRYDIPLAIIESKFLPQVYYFRKEGISVSNTPRKTIADILSSAKTTPSYYCHHCDTYNTKAVPRYKLHLVVLDDTSETKFVVFHNHVMQLLNLPCWEIPVPSDKFEIHEIDEVPIALNNIIGETYQFKIAIERGNFKSSSQTFRVLKIITESYGDDETRNTPQPIESDSSESGDDIWDCSSNEGDGFQSDSEDDVGDRTESLRRYQYTTLVYDSLAKIFGGLQNKCQKELPGPSVLTKIEEDYKDDGDMTYEYPRCGALFWYNERIENSVNEGQGPRVFKLHGENYHMIGSVKPKGNDTAKFSQLYIHDTENEVQNRLTALSGNSWRNKIREDLVEGLMEMFRISNVHVKSFRSVKDRFNDEESSEELSLVLINTRLKDGRVYNLPTSKEVAALVVGDAHENIDKRDIILEKNNGKLKRISELHPSYLPLQYPLHFPYGKDGFRLGIQNGFTGINKKKKPNISMREYFCFRIQVRNIGSQVLLLSRRLLLQFLVDAYTMIESHRLRYICKNQSNLRTVKFSKFVDAANNDNTTVAIEGNRIIIPSSFTGGPRLFKIKLDKLMEDLTKKHILGKTVAAIYTAEFQKRGLPHSHILLFMDCQDKLPNADDIDRIISAEIPDRFEEPKLYEVVKDMMIQGPCGVVNRISPCMQDGKCSKFFPRKHVDKTTVDAQGYPVYRRRDNGNFVEKKGVQCDNRFVVPYNKKLLLGYNAHINVEWCNQSRSIKYLFKYINKGQDRVTGTVTAKKKGETPGAEANERSAPPDGIDINGADAVEPEVDEIKKYFEARYISACESTWRILSFPTQYRSTPVEKLTFHLEGEQPVTYKEGDTVKSVLSRVRLSKTMFLAWFDCCKIYPEARELTYPELPTRFVYDAKLKVWNPRKRGFAIGRVELVSPLSGPRYYLRVLLNKVKGPRCYDDIKTVEGRVQQSFEEACYELGLLDDDKEYIEGLKECAFWASGTYVRNLFANMLVSGSLSFPKLVWDSTFDILPEDVLYLERKKHRNPALILSPKEVLNATLILIDILLRRKNSSLANFDTLPKPFVTEHTFQDNPLLQDELNYSRDELRANHHEWMGKTTDEQRSVYEQIIGAGKSKKGGVFFVYGFGGT